MGGETIKSFLVGLGFEVDSGSLSKFNKSISEATVKVAALATATIAMASAVAKSITSVSADFEEMGYEYHLIAPAINKALLLRQELLRAYSAAGTNIYKVIQSSIKLNFSLDKTKFALKALYSGVAAKFFPLLQKQSDTFRNSLYKNMPKIQHALEAFIKVVFKAFEIVTQLGARIFEILTRVWEFFAKLHQATDGWSTVIIGVIAAWKLLNLAFLATPLGMIISGLTALFLLWDDFKTFKEGGKSLIDWGSDTTKIVVAMTTAILALGAAIGAVILAMKLWTAVQVAFWAVMALNPIGLWITGITILIGLVGALAAKLGLLKVPAEWLSNIGGKIMNFVGGSSSNLGANLQNNPIGQPLANPVGGNVQSSQTNQHVTQQTNINISGASDANATGQAVAGQQTRVNRDSIDYLKGGSK